ncbi:MAG: hypothetical protein J5449_07855 [Oscillospiraceae bacterium]|nr:hypothetical protein [Oscillospiraceae bacterium]
MNRHLEAAIFDSTKINAVICAIDELYMTDADERLQGLVAILADLVNDLSDELSELYADKRVVDAIYAAKETRGE